MDKRYVWLVVQDEHDSDPIFTSFDNSEAAYHMCDYLAKRMNKESVYVERMPVYHKYIIIDDNWTRFE